MNRLLISFLLVLVPIQDTAAIKHAKDVLEMLKQEKYDQIASQFNTQMAAAFNAEKLSQAWKSLQAQAGEFREIIDEKSANPAPGITAVTLGCHFQNADLNIILAFDADSKIAGLRFAPRGTLE